ncbi:MAG TPA: hemolysin family protein [Terriglobales bacterium]|nr:hemolysin family protein [Terriglobales bacterium]
MANVSYELVIIVVLAIINGVFAMSEVALLSSRRTRLQTLADRGSGAAQHALDLLHDPNNFLSTVQIGVTLVGVWAGAFGGATLAEQIAAALQNYPRLAPHAETIGIAVVVLAITYISLVIGELVPKRIALSHPERIASAVARPMTVVSRVVAPLVSLLGASTNALLWIIRVKESTERAITQDDIRALIRIGAQTGVVEEDEKRIVERVFRFADRRASALMTLRSDIEWIDINRSPEEIKRKIRQGHHAHLPVADARLDKVQGILLVREYFAADSPADIRSLLKPAVFVPEGMPALKVLERLRNSSGGVALVVDEYGGVEGLISATDVLEALVGELPGAFPEEHPIVQRADGSWLIDGTLPTEDLRDLLRLDHLPGEESQGFQTAAGFFIHQLGRIPKPADTIEFSSIRFEVVDMDGNRIDKILVTRA